MKNSLKCSILFALFFSFCACQKEEAPPNTPPVIEGFSVKINKDILNQSIYLGYIISDQTGKIYQYELTNGQQFQEDFIYEAEKLSDIEMAVTLISKTPYSNNPNHAFVELTTFTGLPSDAFIEYIPQYYFSWTRSNKAFQISGIDEIDDIKFSNLSTDDDIANASLSGGTFFLSAWLPNNYESLVLVKANGEEEYRYIELLTGGIGGQYSYSDLPIIGKKEILMPGSLTKSWDGYIFGENTATGEKMSLFSQPANGEASDRFLMVYYPTGTPFNNFDFYINTDRYYIYGEDLEIFQQYETLPDAIDPRDQLEFVEKVITPEQFSVRPTTSSDFMIMRYYHVAQSDIRWDIVAPAKGGIVEFTLPLIPDELELEYPNDLIFNRRMEYVYAYLVNVQNPLAKDFWKSPSSSLNFDWLIENGAYSVRERINF
ncbi:MAG: hypothetical protein IPM82_20805 [Saprospiraceae bacterium]|nr:hypothetical protein [Saprospiraceae bacterium]